MSEEFDSTICENDASGLKRASGDASSVEQHARRGSSLGRYFYIVTAYLVSRLRIRTQEALHNLQHASQISSSAVSDADGFDTDPTRRGVGR